jgi:DUF1680 family protein
MQEFTSGQVSLHDPFWSPRQEINAGRAIFHQWEQLEASGCIDNFRILAGEKDGFREGWFFADSDAYKWLEAAARIYALHPDPKLATRMDSLLALLLKARASDGYLFTYNQIHFPGTRWVNLQIEHELYCHGHLIEACIAHHLTTGRNESLALAHEAADLLVHDFMGKGPGYTPGHEEIEIALLRLYQISGDMRYLDLAGHFLEQRGRTPRFALSILRQNASANKRGKFVRAQRRSYLSGHPEHAAFHLPAHNSARNSWLVTLRWFASVLSGKYFQQHAPLRAQGTPVGHAVRFGYLQTATALLQRLRPDTSLLAALEQSWEQMVTRRMYVTGGLGSLPVLEGFGRDYELDPGYAYAETCAALAGMFWNWEMALTTASAKYSELFEWQLYNAAAVGMGLEGESYLYNNPLACRGGLTRQAWFEIPCCPSNLSRTWANLGKYIFSSDGQAVWIHQYIGSQIKPETGIFSEIQMDSGLPYTGQVAIRLTPRTQAEFALHLRLPAWSSLTQVTVNGEAVPVPPAAFESQVAGGAYDPRTAQFLPIRRAWSAGDRIEIEFDLAIRLRRAGSKVKGQRGKVAVTRGPLVYCLESLDNPGVDLFTCRLDPTSLRAEPALELLGGIMVLRATTFDGRALTFIPYFLWANRGPSQMNVWVRT